MSVSERYRTSNWQINIYNIKLQTNFFHWPQKSDLEDVLCTFHSCFDILSPSWLCTSISDSGLSLDFLELDDDEGVDSRSSLSDSVISPSSGSLLPVDSLLQDGFFFFLCFSDFDFFLFFFSRPFSSWCEPFLSFFLFDGDLSFSSRFLEEPFLLWAEFGLRDLRRGFRDSTWLFSSCSCFGSSDLISYHQTVSSENTTSSDCRPADLWLFGPKLLPQNLTTLLWIQLFPQIIPKITGQ